MESRLLAEPASHENAMHDRELRHSVDTAIRVFLDDATFRAEGVNVSAGGACLQGMSRLPAGTQVTIRYLHLCLRARVAWSSDALTGVRFLQRLPTADLRTLQTAIGDNLHGLQLVAEGAERPQD